ncbi:MULTISPECIES: response regulator [unclassified Novosphingobium]|uniref:response regulator n=1 Tax=unclassified Novosphingobium TaxID=2644732 RepID=UPI00086B8E39|nr:MULTISPECIES: response regulator transcription factor [unclassified Novosphingobium]MBN9143367.1 response regulator transcription factor [Novosphingobium sp.]MDR6706615.1 two-component system nitrate/nitrite response regulator NarP [Novosphingobium sp. 1748]ODU83834.1 MAG: DNA-binding response regulator [Novosphingobium sp. SCN 63-17]OJX92582.1 MAG: DNA-binding response regulator [Novosphingobium sp. 63-713]
MTSIVIADDHAFLRAGLEQVLGSLGFAIVASVGDGDAALAAVAEKDPDLVIVDLRMPGRNGVAVLEALREQGDTRPVLMLAAEIDDASLVAAIRLGVNGILLKDSDASALKEAIDTVMAGTRAISMAMMERAFMLASQPSPANPLDALGERDRRIVEGVAAGLRNREIAENLAISEGSVKVYLHRIFDRLNVGNRTELALLVRGGEGGR